MILGIGVDICEIARIESSLDRHGRRFLDKTFTKAEQEYCSAAANASERYAARFAAKEAAMKAFGTGWQKGIGFLSIEIISDELGAPSLRFHRKAAEFGRELGIARTHLSLTHSQRYAVAMVVFEGGSQ